MPGPEIQAEVPLHNPAPLRVMPDLTRERRRLHDIGPRRSCASAHVLIGQTLRRGCRGLLDTPPAWTGAAVDLQAP